MATLRRINHSVVSVERWHVHSDFPTEQNSPWATQVLIIDKVRDKVRDKGGEESVDRHPVWRNAIHYAVAPIPS